MTTNLKLSITMLISLWAITMSAQHIATTLPFGFEQSLVSIEPQTIPDLDWKKIRSEDEHASFDIRFAAPQRVDISTEKNGTWSISEDQRIWRHHIKAETGKGISALLSNIKMADEAILFAYDVDKKHLFGPYSAEQLNEAKSFIVGILSGKDMILEIDEPNSTIQKSSFEIKRIDIAYKNEQSFMDPSELAERGFGDALSCHINANCPDGDNWNNEKRGVCRVMMVLEEGFGWCTGTLMNNARQDGKPYILTAYHCQDGYTPIWDMWRFDFGFEAIACTTPTTAPTFKSMTGCYIRAGRQANDLLLLELDDAIPKSYNLYFNGWDRQQTVPTATVSLHHPKGDLKKITYDTQNSTSIFNQPIGWNNNVSTPIGNHFVVYPNKGTLQVGSSGCALFDSNKRVVATLHGGNFSGCSVDNAYYSRFAISWNQGSNKNARLREWLDPDSTAVLTVNGANQSSLVNNISGRVRTQANMGIGLVNVKLLSRFVKDSVMTDSSGVYTFNIPRYIDSVFILPYKNVNVKNGISTFDLVTIRKHILNVTPITSIFNRFAADVNASGTITTADIVAVQKVNLGINPNFGTSLSWSFYNKDYNLQSAASFLPVLNPIVIKSNILMYKKDFIGIKIGDANESVDPTK